MVPGAILAYELLGITVKTASRTAAPHFPASTAAKRSGQGSWLANGRADPDNRRRNVSALKEVLHG